MKIWDSVYKWDSTLLNFDHIFLWSTNFYTWQNCIPCTVGFHVRPDNSIRDRKWDNLSGCLPQDQGGIQYPPSPICSEVLHEDERGEFCKFSLCQWTTFLHCGWKIWLPGENNFFLDKTSNDSHCKEMHCNVCNC